MQKVSGIIELSKEYYCQEFLPALRKTAPALEPFLAVGLLGEGSECFGFDDEKSRDHDYGPGFCIWLTDEYFGKYSEQLEAIIKGIPQAYGGMKSFFEKSRRGVLNLENFFHGLTGCDTSFFFTKATNIQEAHKQNIKWISLSESGLAAFTNGEVFADNEGTISKLRQILQSGYPEDVNRYKLAQNLISLAQITQYNYPRTFERNDGPALSIMRGRAIEYSCAIAFLINHKFKPYYKWSARALDNLDVLGKELHEMLTLFSRLPDGESVYDAMVGINKMIIEAFHKEGLSENDSEYLLDHVNEIVRKIQDKELLQQAIPLL